VIVDEIHLLSNSSRGAVLEGLLARLRFLQIPIIAMSATVPNVSDLVTFLRAEHFISTWKPVAVEEFIVVPRKEGASQLKALQVVHPDGSQVGLRRMEAPMLSEVTPLVLSPHPVLVFCPTKLACFNCAKALANDLHAIAIAAGVDSRKDGSGCSSSGGSIGDGEDQDAEALRRRRQQLTAEMKSANCIFTSDIAVWNHLVGVGVAYHHGG
jgi:replicative superfamily II helicase